MAEDKSRQSPEKSNGFSLEEFLHLQEELELIRQENKQCWQHVQQLETTVARMRSAAQCSKDERDRLKKKLRELQSRLANSSSNVSDASTIIDRRLECQIDNEEKQQRPNSTLQSSPSSRYQSAEYRPPTPAITPKIAERVRLKRYSTDDVHGAEICSLGISNVRLAEHLSEEVQEASQLQEIYRALMASARKQEFELELENLRGHANRMKSQISFLELTLNESKTLSDNLSSLCAQLESNNTALHLALLLDDYTEKALDCLLQLADSQLAFVLASCQAVHCSEGEDNHELLSLARRERETAERDAKNLLNRLANDSAALIGQDNVGSEHETPNVQDDGKPWSRNDELRLRSLVGTLRIHRDAVRRSVVEVSSSGSFNGGNEYADGRQIGSIQEEKLSLENVVLLQELMAIKEDKTHLKGKAMILEKENEILTLSIRGKDLELESLRRRLDSLCGNIEQAGTELDKGTNTTRSIIIDESGNLSESILVNQELYHRKSDYLIQHLKRINVSLMTKLERSKRKHRMKLCRLQQALRYVSEQYELEMSALRGQLSSETRDSGNETLFSNTSEA